MNSRFVGFSGVIGVILLLLGGCGSQSAGAQPPTVEKIDQEQSEATVTLSPTKKAEEVSQASEAEPAERRPSLEVVQELLPAPDNTLAEGEYRWSQLLGRDSILPIYEEAVIFSDAANAPYEADELVIGVEINGEAKAYAIGPLNAREMVNDTVGGVPILVTW